MVDKPTAPTTSRRSPFFLGMSVLILLIVLGAFSPTFFLVSQFGGPTVPQHLVVHGAILTAWFAWFCVQTGLVAAGRTRWHRRTGVVGAVLGLMVVPAGLSAALRYAPRLAATDAGLGDSLARVSQVVWGNFGMLLAFAALLIVALRRRMRRDWHARLMLAASISLLGPAFARVARFDIFPSLTEPPLIAGGTAFLFGLLAFHDRRQARRLHAATLVGAVVLTTAIVAGFAIGSSPFGRAFIASL